MKEMNYYTVLFGISRALGKMNLLVDLQSMTTWLNPSCFQICKYFLEAVENSKYGWFWTCPAGGDQCNYRHALPAGYVLKKVS